MTSDEGLAPLVALLPDPMLMVSADGLIRAANDPFIHMLGCQRRDLVGTSLSDHLAEPAAQVRDYLTQCARTRQPLPGVLTLARRGAAPVRRRCEGWVVHPRAAGGPAIVGLRILRTDVGVARFADLTRQVGELTAEISRRRRAEAQLASALEARTALQERFAALADAPAALLASLIMEDVERALGALATRLVPADAHAIWRYEGSGEVWRIVWQDGLSPAFVREITGWQSESNGAVPFEAPLPVPDVSRLALLSNRQDVYGSEGIESLLIIPLRIRAENHGTIVAYFRRRVAFSDELLRVAAALGNLGSSALTTAALYDFESRTRKNVELAERRARFLAGAAAALAGALSHQDLLRTVAHLAVPEMADWCAVDVLAADGTLQRAAVAQGDRVDAPLDPFLRDLDAVDAAPFDAHQVLRTNRSLKMTRLCEVPRLAGPGEADALSLGSAPGLRSYMCVPLAVHGRAIGVVTFVSAESGRDYTEDDLRLAEDVASRAALAVENAKAYEEARQANQVKEDFLATLSHELRTPLNAILGYVRMLRAGAVPPERQPRALEVVERNATALNGMVEDVLDVSRVVAGKVRLNLEPVNVSDVMQDAVATISPAAEAKGVRIQTLIDPHAAPVSGDAARLQQVVWNLLSNAVKFTPRGGRVELRVEERDSHVEIVVSDTGIGVAAEFLPHIFERFRQADARFSREYGGLGLGLAIARHFVELHGGAITAASAGPDQGTTFRVRLPSMALHMEAAAAPPLGSPLASLALPGLSLPAISGIHVLAVDDEPDSRALIAEILEAAGARVTLAGSGADALQALARDVPHVVITDIGMPGMDGFELLARLRQSGSATGSLPVAALTAYARSEDRIRAMENGFQMHLAKPINPAELIAAVRLLADRSPESS